MTKQQIFDKVVRGLAKQGFRQSMGGALNNVCSYRGKRDTKCAAGHLIPDRLYRKDLEAKIAEDPAVRSVLIDGGSRNVRSNSSVTSN